MRISIDGDDPAYTRDTAGYSIYFDGKLQKGVITADEAQGLMVKYEQNEAGDFIVKGNDLVIAKYLGDVVIVSRKERSRTDGLYAK